MFQVSAALSKLISEIFWALLETGCCTLRADGDRMMLWLTCLSSLHLLLLSTVKEKGITLNLRRYTLILNSSQFPILECSWEPTWLVVFWMWKSVPPVAAVQPWWCIGSRWGRALLVSGETCLPTPNYHEGSRYRSRCLEEQAHTLWSFVWFL